MKKRVIALALGCTVAFGCAVGGTLAWLTADGGTVTNTFTVGDVKIELTESGADNNGAKNYNFVPGDKLAKDPKITVQATTEPCYVFLKMTKSNMIQVKDSSDNVVDALKYSVNGNWQTLPVTGADNGVTYYYKELTTQTTNDTDYYILTGEGNGDYKNGMVAVSEYVTKDNVETLTKNKPKLEFAAAAIQSANVGGLQGAWDNLPSEFKGDANYTDTPAANE